eukprot:834133-Amphidinium_carterae.1
MTELIVCSPHLYAVLLLMTCKTCHFATDGAKCRLCRLQGHLRRAGFARMRAVGQGTIKTQRSFTTVRPL